MSKPQWIAVSIAVILTIGIFFLGRTVPSESEKLKPAETHSPDDGHDHGVESPIQTDSLLLLAKQQLNNEQVKYVTELENQISRGDVKNQQIKVYRDLAKFWGDSMRIFQPYAWYKAEEARLENSEKTLTFAARLFLDNLQQESDGKLRQWSALQAKDLFERSLKINPDNDSAKVGLGACYLFGNISSAPMEGISKIMEVVQRDSTHIYGQMTLAKGAILSGQYDKAITRLQTINKLQPGDAETMLMLADVYERTGKKEEAVNWYQHSLDHIENAGARKAIEDRIASLKK